MLASDQPAQAGAFAREAFRYFEAGLAVLPTGGPDGKQPIMRGFNKSPLGPDGISRFAEKYPGANLGLHPTFSKLAVVDVDSRDDDLHAAAIKRFGDTPIKVRTGSGNLQLYYRRNRAVTSMDLRSIEGVPIEIKSRGTIVIAPPSTNFQTGGQYSFIDGNLDRLADLPPINLKSLHMPDRRTRDGQLIEQGRRNSCLFRHGLQQAPHCDDFDALADVMRTYADDWFGESMDETEVIKTAQSVWRYEQSNDPERGNWIGQEARVTRTNTQIRDFGRGIDGYSADAVNAAFRLLQLLEVSHRARQAPFAIAAKSMAKQDVLPGWTIRKYRDATKALLATEQIRLVRPSAGPGVPALYDFTKKGAQNAPYITKTPGGRGTRGLAND